MHDRNCDQQGGVAVAQYTTNLQTIANRNEFPLVQFLCSAFSPYLLPRQIVAFTVLPLQTAAHAKYTVTLKKFCIQNGYEFADMRRNFGANLGWYGGLIHPTVDGQISIMAAWAEALTRMLKNKRIPSINNSPTTLDGVGE